jgi:hypothetical protein
MLSRMLGSGKPAWHGRLMAREMVEPTPIFDELLRHTIRPTWDHLHAIVADALGPQLPADTARTAAQCVIGMMTFHCHCAPVLERLHDKPIDEADLAGQLAPVVGQMAWGALQALRQKHARAAGARD